MMIARRSCLALIVATLVAGCGGGREPEPPAPQTVTLAVEGMT